MTEKSKGWWQACLAYLAGSPEREDLFDELDFLWWKIARGEACRCGHRQVDHIMDSVIRAVFCRECRGTEDLHEFEAKKCGRCGQRDRACRCDLPIAQAIG